jgi:hypothetical protein
LEFCDLLIFNCKWSDIEFRIGQEHVQILFHSMVVLTVLVSLEKIRTVIHTTVQDVTNHTSRCGLT